ncbi:hypothetical protein [Streptomyces sp. NPDC001889]
MRKTLFRQLVEEKRWTQHEVFNAQYQQAAQELSAQPGLKSLKYAFILQRTFERWMRGDVRRLPQHEARAILEHLLGRPAQELFASVTDIGGSEVVVPAVPVSSPGGLPEAAPGLVPLPGFLAPDSMAVAGSAAPGFPWPAEGSRLAVADGDVQVIRSMLTALTASDHQFGGGHARAYATDYLRRVVQPRLHTHMSDPVRGEMFQTATEFAVRVAWMHFDVGHHELAGRFLALALSAAQEADDPTLMGWVLAMRGLTSVWALDAEKALSYTEGAVGMTGRSPWKARAFVTGKAALAMSLTGDRDSTHWLLWQVRGYLERADGAGEPAWSDIYDLAYLRDEEGNCFRNLGLGREAVEAEEEAMRLRGSGRNSYARLRAFSLAVQAVGHMQAGEVEQGAVVGTELVGLLPAFSSQRVQRRLQDVLNAAQPYRQMPAVRDFFEVARSALPNPSPDFLES